MPDQELLDEVKRLRKATESMERRQRWPLERQILWFVPAVLILGFVALLIYFRIDKARDDAVWRERERQRQIAHPQTGP